MKAITGKIREIVGDDGMIDEAERMTPYLWDQRKRFLGSAYLIAFPSTVEDVMAVVQACAQEGCPIVPQGGNTGLVAGAVAFSQAVILNLKRMNRIREVNREDATLTVEAGCTLETVRRIAAANQMRFPLSFKAEEWCQIGGCLSTNAGGLLTVRYGSMRDLTLGLEVVLPNGEKWSSLRPLYKNNTGYDLKHLFIGGEGTLGIITAASLKGSLPARAEETVWVGLESVDAAIALFGTIRQVCGETLQAFELIPRLLLTLAMAHIEEAFDPLTRPYPWYVLLSLESTDERAGLREMLNRTMERFIRDREREYLQADERTTAARLWRIRDAIVVAQNYEGAAIKNDIAVPRSQISTFMRRAYAEVQERFPQARPVGYGHVGDGNIHFNVMRPPESDPQDFLSHRGSIESLVNDLALQLGGTISAEHGIGAIKVHELARMKGPLEISLMESIKRVFDPYNLMNPGKILASFPERP